MCQYFETLYSMLKSDNWKEPTTDKYMTYLKAYKKHGRNAKSPYYEDIHNIWRHYKPINY